MASNVRITKQAAQVLQRITDADVRITKQAAQLVRTNTSGEVRCTKIVLQVLRLEIGPAHTTGGTQKVGGIAF